MLTQARSRNAQLGITGHLLYSEEAFVQCIEGPSKSVALLWDSLNRDDRHYDIELLARSPIDSRRFEEWSMAFSSYPSLNRFNMEGFFPVTRDGMNEAVERCATV